MNIRKHLRSICRRSASAVAVMLILFSSAVFKSAPAQQLGPFDRERGAAMLKALKDDVKKYYFDPNYRNINLDAKFKDAEEKVKQASSNGQIFGIIAQTLLDFEDSHTFFLPPSRSASVDYGWRMQVVGDKCFITAIKPESDADKKGLKPGDLVLSVNGFTPMRENLWKINYVFNTLRPQPGLRISVQSPDGNQRQLDVTAKVAQGKQIMNLAGDEEGEDSDIYDLIRESENENYLNRHRILEMNNEVSIWKMPQFDLSEDEVDKVMDKIKKRKSLILDLRGNPGGYVRTLQRLTGHFFDRDVKIGDVKGRKDSKPLNAKTRGSKAFTGKLVVLIDAKSASAAELFSRLVQLEKRGTVIGDLSSGAVMVSRVRSHQLGTDTVIFYGASITESDIIMTDGKSIEHVGVAPDEKLLPTAEDLASSRDPVMAKAAELVGLELSPEKAGTLFPIEWKK